MPGNHREDRATGMREEFFARDISNIFYCCESTTKTVSQSLVKYLSRFARDEYERSIP